MRRADGKGPGLQPGRLVRRIAALRPVRRGTGLGGVRRARLQVLVGLQIEAQTEIESALVAVAGISQIMCLQCTSYKREPTLIQQLPISITDSIGNQSAGQHRMVGLDAAVVTVVNNDATALTGDAAAPVTHDLN